MSVAKFNLCIKRSVPVSSVIVCVLMSGWDYKVWISISRTNLGISEYAGEAHICRLHYQVLLSACVVQNSGRTEQNNYALFQN